MNPSVRKEMRETWVQSLGQEDPLKKEVATQSRILAWRIPWTEGPGGLQSMGSQRVRHDLTTKHTHTQYESWNVFKVDHLGGFPGGLVVKNPPCNASLTPGQGTKIPHITEQLSPHATTRESMCCKERSCIRQQRSSKPQPRPHAAN